jgi:hypothetical protein
MNQSLLYDALLELDCDVLMFEDHPNFFGNWRASFKHRGRRYEVVSDSREGWLTLWHHPAKNKAERVHDMNINQLNDTDEIATLKSWVEGLKA